MDSVPTKDMLRLIYRGYALLWNKDPLILLSTAISAIVSALTPYVGIYISAQIINEISGQRNSGLLVQLVIIALISALYLSILTAGLDRWKNIHRGGEWYKRRKILTDKLLSLDFCDIDNSHIYDNLAQINQNDMWGRWGLAVLIYEFESLVKSLTVILGAIALTITLFTLHVPENNPNMLFLNNPLLLVSIIIIMIIISFVTPILSSKAESYYTKIGDEAKLSNRLFYFFGYIGYDRSKALDIRMYRQDIIIKEYNEMINKRFGSESTLATYARGLMGGLNALSAAISHIFMATIYIYICLKAWSGAFGVGSVTQYIGATMALSTGVSGMIAFFGSMRNNSGFLQKVFEFLDVPNSMRQGSLPVNNATEIHEIEFQNVSFKYPSADEYALKNISLKIKKGQSLAIVGQNGSGKTTFIKLLCRLYDPTEGVILLNGKDIKDYDYMQYLTIFSVVFQDFKLLPYILGQNISAMVTYNEKIATECLEKTGFGERLRSMEKGLETYLYKDFEENGVEISGGEAQKIALARALYKNAPFIILDEPTAALDPITEYEIYNKMNEIIDDKMTVFISHRLSSCRFCDDIVVFHDGEIIQRGNHDTLLVNDSGKYYELWNAQAQYYK